MEAALLLQTARDLLEKRAMRAWCSWLWMRHRSLRKPKRLYRCRLISFDQQCTTRGFLRVLCNKKIRVPLFRSHVAEENARKGQCALIDSLLLSRCQYLLKCQSALFGWSKVWNQGIEAYRVAVYKTDWFPDAFIPLYEPIIPGLRLNWHRFRNGRFQ